MHLNLVLIFMFSFTYLGHVRISKELLYYYLSKAFKESFIVEM